MKISHDLHPVVAVDWQGGAQNHWRAIFDQGIVQHGSSGSPLFNQNNRIVGQLHGNQNNLCGTTDADNACHCKQTPIGEYGRFDISWTGGGTNATRLSSWLAPGLGNNAPQTLDGIAEPIITGPSTICLGSPQSFSVTNVPAGFSWDKSSNLTLSSTTSNPVTVSAANSNSNGWGYVSIKNSSGVMLTSKSVWIGKPIAGTTFGNSITGPSTAEAAKHHIYSIDALCVHAPTTISWSGSTGTFINWTYVNPTTLHEWNLYSADVTFSQNGTQWVEAQGNNACGSTPVRKYVTVTGESFDSLKSVIYPNPASDIFYIELSEKKAEQNLTEGKPVKDDPVYDIRLYDMQGTLLRQRKTKGGTVEFNVANLPNGIYYLHIYDGESDKPEMRQVMIER